MDAGLSDGEVKRLGKARPVAEGLPKGRLVLVPFKNVLLVLSCGCFYRLDGFNLLRNGCRDRINSIEAIGQHKMKKLGVLSLR